MNKMLTAGSTLALIATGAIAAEAIATRAWAQQQGMPAQLVPAVQATRVERAPAVAPPSLTWGQAKARLEAEGYSDVRGLVRDPSGGWRAKAVKEGKPSTVGVSASGDVLTR